jgi:hypothetical protein
VGKELATLAFAVFTVFQYFLLAAYISQVGTEGRKEGGREGKSPTDE